MNTKDIEALINQGESETLEFKKSTGELEGAFRTLCAFLNGHGGMVAIGVSDKGKIVGQTIEDSTKKSIAVCEGKIYPPAKFDISYPEINGRKIILIAVKGGIRAPYLYDGRPYQRRQSTTVVMLQPFYEELISTRNQINFSWEKFVAEKRFSVIDEDLLLGVIRAGVEKKRLPESALRESHQKMLERLNLMHDGNLINAGVVLFGTKFMPEYSQCQLKLARFKGINRSEFLDQNILYGNAFFLLDEALFFVKRNVPISAKIEEGKLERVETPPIPFAAIREAMINALCHRDYSSNGGSIMLAIYDDRMEISNDGGLLNGMTIEQIKAGFSKQRNPVIADVFYKGCLIEKYGRGIQKIIDECTNAHVPAPEFFSDHLQFKVIFKFLTSIGNVFNLKNEAQEDSKQNLLSDRQLAILEILRFSESMKIQEIISKLESAPIRRTVQRDLAKLKQLGFVDLEVRGKDSVWMYLKK